MKRTVFVCTVVCLLSLAPRAEAMGCFEGAALGGVVGHEMHHTFLGLFGGCAGGMVVHHMYAAWKRKHPNGTMKEFVEQNKDRLPEGWADRLGGMGDTHSLNAGH